MIAVFRLADISAVFAGGKNGANRDGVKQAVHGLLLRCRARFGEKNVKPQSTVACATAGVKFGKTRKSEPMKHGRGCENDPGTSKTPYRRTGSQNILKNYKFLSGHDL